MKVVAGVSETMCGVHAACVGKYEERYVSNRRMGAPWTHPVCLHLL